MKLLFFVILLCLSCNYLIAQTGSGFRPTYHLIRSDNIVADKNFYGLTVINQSPAIQHILGADPIFIRLLHNKLPGFNKARIDSCSSANCLVSSFKFSGADSLSIVNELNSIYTQHPNEFDAMINQHLRPSGCYERFINMDNRSFLSSVFSQSIHGINTIIDEFGVGIKMLYPKIDSASYDINGDYYKGVLRSMLELNSEESADNDPFYEPSQRVALQLMDMNDRDEPARLEPLELHENRKAVEQIGHCNWSKYKYASIEVPGSGPDVYTQAISPICKIRCSLAALRYRKGWAPFIIVSGGFVHPFHTKYCEALEMKRYLMEKLHIPESAILIEPQARHTTTNLRNVNRLMYRYSIPANKPSVFVSTKSQIDWVMDQLPNQNFDNRCLLELGYLPYRDKKRLSDEDMIFFPTRLSLQMDPVDPLDP